MAPLTRRRLLHGAVALSTVVAGCNETLSGSSTRTRSVPRDEETGPVPDHYVLRNPDESPPVWFPDDERDATADGATSDGPPERVPGREFVASTEDADELRFADVDGADEARQFVAETDFDAETVFVQTRLVEECHTLELCSVSWSARDIETDYGREYRDADVTCRTDARDGVSVLIRIPEALDPDSVNSYGSSWSSSSCRRGPPPRQDGTTTEAPDYGPKTPTNATDTTEEER